MHAVERLSSYISRGVYTVSGPFHPFGGAVDIIVVEQKDGSFKSSPWNVRFGKFQGVLKTREKVVDITVNEVQTGVQMYLDHKGEAYFLNEIVGEARDSILYPSSGDETDEQKPHSDSDSFIKESQSCNPGSNEMEEIVNQIDLSNEKIVGSINPEGCDFEAKPHHIENHIDLSNEMIVDRSCSRRSRILGLVFGQRSIMSDRVREEEGELAANLLDVNWSTNLSAPSNSKEKNSFSPMKMSPAKEDGSLNVDLDRICDFGSEKSKYSVEESVAQMPSLSRLELDVEMCMLGDLEGDHDNSPLWKEKSILYCETSGDDSNREACHIPSVNSEEASHSSSKEYSPQEQCALFSSKCSNNQGVFRDSDGCDFIEDAPNIENPDPVSISSVIPSNSVEDSHELNFDFGLEPSVLSEEENPVFRDIAEMCLKEPSCSSSEREKHHNLDDFLNDFEESIENPRATSSPINIPTSNKVLKQEVEHSVKSLPNIWSLAESQEFLHPLSRTVGSNSKSMDSAFYGRKSLDCIDSDTDKKCQLAQNQPTVEGNQISVELHNVAPSGSWRIWPFSFKNPRTKRPSQTAQSVCDVENPSKTSVGMDVENHIHKIDVTKMKMRTLTPTSEQMASLNLQKGRNIVTFTFSTKVLGKQQVDARIYLWKWNTQMVISDVDGTITKSDVLGQFMPLVGYDWSQTGVAHLFTAIKENGYQLLFLSARAISQAYHTRQFLFNLKQDGKVLPDGPVVISPDGFFPSLFREVIRRAPHEFKIACLEDIKGLFPSDCNPFYAGFGNRDTDEISYIKVGIPKGKIFIINPKGEVAVNRRVDTKSYMSLHALVNGMFPPMSSSEQEDYNSWNYWRMPAPTIQA